MKKLSMLILFLVFISASIFGWQKTPAANAVDVAVAEDGTVAVANRAGELWISIDAGTNWTRSPQASGVIRVSMSSDASIMGIVNRDGQFFVSRDRGASWTTTTATGIVDASVGRTNTFIVNRAGEVWFSPNNFTAWRQTNIVGMNLVVFGGPFILLVDRAGVVHTADFSNNPSLAIRRTPGTNSVDIDVSPNGQLWSVNTAGEIWFSADRGTTWRKDADAANVAAVSKCNRYTFIVNKTGEVWFKTN